MNRKHILVISQYFYPEQFRINDMCEEWVKKGYKVSVITGIPNYPEGNFYNGYGYFKRNKDIYKGIDIYRIPLIPRKKNSIMLAFNYLSFVISGYFWQLFTKIKADYVFVFEVSPMTQALPGVWYAKRRNIPCYIYVQDLWPENVQIVTGINNKVLINQIGRMVDYIYKNCTKIFTTSESFVQAIIDRNVDPEKVEFWPQYAEDYYQPMTKKQYYSDLVSDEKLNIIFTGNIGFAQGLNLLVEAAVILRDKEFQGDIMFIIVGDGRYKQDLIQKVEENKLIDMFKFIERKPAEEIPKLLSSADIAYLSFADNELFNMTIPAKLQSYMACGMPILASASGESEKIINESNSGFCTKTGDAKALVDSIIQFRALTEEERKKMGNNARNYYVNNFDKAMLISEIDIYFKK